ncbi:MAG: hypothetical protein JWQ62_2678 [Lacunisphaera sp.]|nr:hypothetical protein [Lacunisphaera sp.]
MRYVILRDDDTCALTPVESLERLYRPFLERGLPVNLATIPNVRTDAKRPDGLREGFLQFNHETTAPFIPIGQHHALVDYLLSEPLYHVLHHGYDHSVFEFDCNAHDAEYRLAAGAQRLAAAGFPTPHAFVAPYDRLSPAAMQAAARRYPVISTGWFELRRLPRSWWPAYVAAKLRRRPHWSTHGTLLLSHPGCLLSKHRPFEDILGKVMAAVATQPLTVLVTHWWEYFDETKPNTEFISVLHQVADHLARDPGVRVISFADLATGRVTLPWFAPAGAERPSRDSGSVPAPGGQPAC